MDQSIEDLHHDNICLIGICSHEKIRIKQLTAAGKFDTYRSCVRNDLLKNSGNPATATFYNLLSRAGCNSCLEKDYDMPMIRTLFGPATQRTFNENFIFLPAM